MTDTLIEPEVTAVHAPGTDLSRYVQPAAPEEYRARFVMEPAEAAALDKQLRECMRAVLQENVDYGLIPGMGNKPSLFKPGAEKLVQWFGFGFENVRDEIERDSDGARVGVTYRCTVYKQLTDGRKVTVATCEGYAGYDEDKFYTSAERARAKAEENELKWARKDKREPNPKKWENAAEYRAPWNSVLKMAQKRALVGAAIDATAAAGLFTQDIEDMRDSARQDTGALAEAGRDAIMALPDDVRSDLDRWYRGKRWPDPSQWTVEQWCAALQTAGYLTANREQPKRAQGNGENGTQAGGKPVHMAAAEQAASEGRNPVAAAYEAATGDPVPDGAAEDPEAEFVRKFVARTASAGPDDIRPMRAELGKAIAAGVIASEVATDLGKGLMDRQSQLRDAA